MLRFLIIRLSSTGTQKRRTVFCRAICRFSFIPLVYLFTCTYLFVRNMPFFYFFSYLTQSLHSLINGKNCRSTNDSKRNTPFRIDDNISMDALFYHITGEKEGTRCLKNMTSLSIICCLFFVSGPRCAVK